MKRFEVIDNFLPLYDWDKFNLSLSSDKFPWYKTPAKIPQNPIQEKEYHAFTHNMIMQGKYRFEADIDYVDVLMKRLKEIKGIQVKGFEVIRAKANMFIQTEENLGLGLHYDIMDNDDYETLLFFVNENNGGVEFEDKTFIRQKENRAVIIYGRLKHQTITQTDARERYNVNINYKELHE